MKQRAIAFAVAVSFLLCILLIGLWLSTIFAEWRVGGNTAHWEGEISFYRSGFTLLIRHNATGDPFGSHWAVYRYARFGYSEDVWGFNFERKSDAVKLGLPYWLVIGTLAILPWRWFASRRKRVLIMNPSGNLCENCGYCLNGNISGTCPECGLPIGTA